MKKTTLLCAIMAAAFSSVTAQAKTENIEVYGQMAVSAYSLSPEKGDATTGLENESRIGFRGSKDLERGPELFWQIEGGNVGGGSGANDGKLGFRDTFGGFRGGFGAVRFGRMLTPLYEIVDWPYSNPGLGNVFDWGYGISGGAYYDRQSDQVRWDSPDMSGFRVNISTGKGNVSDDDSMFFGGAAHYAKGPVTAHLGVEKDMARQFTGKELTTEQDVTTEFDSLAMIAGVELSYKGFGLSGAYKTQKAEYDNENTVAGGEQSVDSFSVIAQYSGVENVIFKVGFAANSEVEQDGKDLNDTADNVISGQVLYFLDPTAVTYLRVKQMELNATDYTEVRLGVEYGF